MASIDNVVRPVGSQAKFHTARHSLGILRAVIVTCRYKVSAAYLQEQSLTLHDAIENALATVVLKQGVLRVGITGEDTKEPAFVHLKTIDMRRMIEWKELTIPVSSSKRGQDEAHYEDRLLRSLEKYHEVLWEDLANKPGWKIVVHHDPKQLGALHSASGEGEGLLSFDISFCFHHVLSDGRGAYIFHGDLQRALNTASQPPELQNHILHLPTASMLPPAIDRLIPFSLSWSYILRTVWTELLYPVVVPPFLRRLLRLEPSEADIPWTGAPIDGANPKVHIRTLFTANEAALQKILAQCRAHKTSLTGLLHALIARSLARLVKDKAFRSVTPISIAGYASPSAAFTPSETIHCLVAGFSCEHDRGAIRRLRDDDAAFWGFARDMTARLRAKTASLPRDDLLALYGLVGDWHEFFRGKFGKARDGTWELSNLGSLPAADASVSSGDEKYGEWLVDRAVFTQGANPVGPAIHVNVAGVAGNGVYATVNWQDGIVNADLVEELAVDVQTWVNELGQA
ncbi:alcohol acetyltransferase [Nemania sp. FL0031]|nr:alcohol acetyltransferase [Nemania sp. FL0031]